MNWMIIVISENLFLKKSYEYSYKAEQRMTSLDCTFLTFLLDSCMHCCFVTKYFSSDCKKYKNGCCCKRHLVLKIKLNCSYNVLRKYF